MATSLDDLGLYQRAQSVCDAVWELASGWPRFEREVVGSQFIRAADSIGANIAEAHGRFHYGEKAQFMYYARGSLYETRHWLHRANRRRLIEPPQYSELLAQLDALAHDINRYVNYLRSRRQQS